jgi:hypothetical protein
VFGKLLAVAIAEFPDDAGEGHDGEFALGAVVAADFGAALITPELLTELHRADVLLAASRPVGAPEVEKLVVGLSPPLVWLSSLLSKVDSPLVPEPPLAHGAGLAIPPNGAVVISKLLPGVWPKFAPSGDVAATLPPGPVAPVCVALGALPGVWPRSAPSGDVAPITPGLVVPVCAALWPTPSASISVAARRNFILIPPFRA